MMLEPPPVARLKGYRGTSLMRKPPNAEAQSPDKQGDDDAGHAAAAEREFFIDNLLVRIHLIIVMIRWTGLAPWEFELPFQQAG